MPDSDLTELVDAIREDGLPNAVNRFYSIYRATVTSNQDPLNLGRVQVQCGVTQGKLDAWVKPALPGAGLGRGFFFVPEVGDTVFISFYEGDPNRPEVYFGGWYGQATNGSSSDVPTFLQPPSSGLPEKKGMVTRAGHALVFNDEAGKESVTLVWNQPDPGDPAVKDRTKTAAYNKKVSSIFTFDKNGLMIKTASSYVIQIDEAKGAMTLTAPSGSMFSITPNGVVQMVHKSGASIGISDKGATITANPSSGQNTNISGQAISLNGGAINIGSKAADFAVLGLKLIVWLAKHTHPYAFGVTAPPVPPPTPADFCSQTVKLQA